MAQITLNIPDAVAGRVLDAFAALYGWDPNGSLTKSQFAKLQIIANIKSVVRDAEGSALTRSYIAQREAAVSANNQDVESNVVIS